MSHRIHRALCLAAHLAVCIHAHAGDQPQWGERHTRNMISPETNLPTRFDPISGAGVKWSAPLGGNAYGTPSVAQGCVFMGANNEVPRDPRIAGDSGVLLCLDEKDGSLRWQLTAPRIGGDDYLDWPKIAACTPPTIEGKRVYTLTNRFEVVCLDLEGQRNGNDGPYQDEGQHAVRAGEAPIAMTDTDADILWLTDLPQTAGIYTHDAAQTSILIDGDYLYLNSCNGVDNTHRMVRKPDAPSLIVLDKHTGRLLAHDNERMGPFIIHAAWSPPALGEVNGLKRIFFGGPDGWAYAFEPLPVPAPKEVQILKRVWRFNGDPAAPTEDVHSYQSNRKVSRSAIESMPVFYKQRLYITVGGDIWWGKRQAWLKCIDATKTGDITESGLLWSYEIPSHSSTTPAIANGLVFVADCDGMLHAVDAETGEGVWQHDVGGEIWGSPLVADGKVHVGSLKRNFAILSATREKNLIASIKFPQNIASTPVAANGTLYVNTLDTLYAFGK